MVYESRLNEFRTWYYFSTSVSYRYFGMFLWILFQNPKNNSLFHKHDNTKNRFPRLCSKNGMNVGVMRIVGHYYPFTHESLPSAYNLSSPKQLFPELGIWLFWIRFRLLFQ